MTQKTKALNNESNQNHIDIIAEKFIMSML